MTDQELVNIDAFWNWFRVHSDRLAHLADRREATEIACLEDKIATLVKGAVWEIGPGVTARRSFVFSPNRNLKLLPLTRSVVARAPLIPGWEFLASRPRKNWRFCFNMFNNLGQHIAIDATNWRYSLVAYNNRSFFDLTLHATDLPKMDKTACQQASWIAVEGAIGEDLALERLGAIKMSDSSILVRTDQTGRIDRLYDHMVELLNKSTSSSPRKV